MSQNQQIQQVSLKHKNGMNKWEQVGKERLKHVKTGMGGVVNLRNIFAYPDVYVYVYVKQHIAATAWKREYSIHRG